MSQLQRLSAVRDAVPCLLDDLVRVVIGYDIDCRVLAVVNRGDEKCVVAVNPADGSHDVILTKLEPMPRCLVASADDLLFCRRSGIIEWHSRRPGTQDESRLLPVSTPELRGLICSEFPLRRSEFCAIYPDGVVRRASYTTSNTGSGRVQAHHYHGKWNIDGHICGRMNADLRRIFLTRKQTRASRSSRPTLNVIVRELGGTDWHLLVVYRPEPVMVSLVIANLITKTVASVEQIRLCDECARLAVRMASCWREPQFEVLQPLESADEDSVYPFLLFGQTLKLIRAPRQDESTFAETVCDHTVFGVATSMNVSCLGCYASGHHMVLLVDAGVNGGAIVVLTMKTVAINRLPTRYFTCNASCELVSVDDVDGASEATDGKDATKGASFCASFCAQFAAACEAGRDGWRTAAVVMMEIEWTHSILALPDGAFAIFTKDKQWQWSLLTMSVDHAGIPRINSVSRNLGDTIGPYTWSHHYH